MLYIKVDPICWHHTGYMLARGNHRFYAIYPREFVILFVCRVKVCQYIKAKLNEIPLSVTNIDHVTSINWVFDDVFRHNW